MSFEVQNLKPHNWRFGDFCGYFGYFLAWIFYPILEILSDQNVTDFFKSQKVLKSPKTYKNVQKRLKYSKNVCRSPKCSKSPKIYQTSQLAIWAIFLAILAIFH